MDPRMACCTQSLDPRADLKPVLHEATLLMLNQGTVVVNMSIRGKPVSYSLL